MDRGRGRSSASVGGWRHADPRRGGGCVVVVCAIGDRLATVYVDTYRALCPVSRCLMSSPPRSGPPTAFTCEKKVGGGRETWCTRLSDGVALALSERMMTTNAGVVSTKTWEERDTQLACSRARTDLQRRVILLRSSTTRPPSPFASASMASEISATEWSSLRWSSLSRWGSPP